MTIGRNERHYQEQETDGLLRRFFTEVHADDRAPSFREMAHPSHLAPSAVWRPAFAVLAVVLMAAGIAWVVPALRGSGSDSLSEAQQFALAQALSSFETPLDFLLETPGRELLYAPPSFELMEILWENTP